jgi:hypothetical protein
MGGTNNEISEETAKLWEGDIAELEPEHWEHQFGGPDDDEQEDNIEREEKAGEELIALAKRYVELKCKIGQLTEELTDAKEQLLNTGMETGETITVAGHRLLGCVSKRYTFSSNIDDLESELRQRKKDDIEAGRAKVTHKTHYVRCSRLLADIRAEFPHAGIPWTQGELEVLKAEDNKGTPVKIISVLLGRPSRAIRSRLAKTDTTHE